METMVICPGCGHGNLSDASYCVECRSRLNRGLRVSPEEARDIEDRRLSEARRRRMIRWALVLTVAVVAVVGATAYTTVGPGGQLDPPSTDIGAVSAPGDWPMYRGDPAHSGYVHESQPAPDGAVAWQFRTAERLYASPSVVQDVLYLSSGDRRVVALDAHTGEVKWEREVSGPVNSSPAIAGDLVFVGLRDGRLLALDKMSGMPRWEFQTGDLVYGSPAVHGGVAYIGSGDRRIYALDAFNGEERWSKETGGRVVAAPAVIGDYVAVVSQDQQLYIYDAGTGGFRLDYPIRDTPDSAALDRDRAYVANSRGFIQAIDLKQKQVPFEKTARFVRTQLFFWGIWNSLPVTKGFEWGYRAPGEVFRSAPALDSQRLYVASESGVLYALNKSSGERVWKFEMDNGSRASPTLAGDTLYMADTAGTVYGIDAATGEEMWRFELNDRVSTSVVVGGGKIFVAADSGVLYAVR